LDRDAHDPDLFRFVETQKGVEELRDVERIVLGYEVNP
jgi:hypothetical protein